MTFVYTECKRYECHPFNSRRERLKRLNWMMGHAQSAKITANNLLHWTINTLLKRGVSNVNILLITLQNIMHYLFFRLHFIINRRRFSDEWIGPPDEVTISEYLRFNRQLIATTILAHWITSPRVCIYDLASGGNSSDKLGRSRVPKEYSSRTNSSQICEQLSYRLRKISVFKISR